ncbi:hypothetical protein Pan44_48100 [Caulifigura coniformis]|uniref:Uncharacterized protein n=1 Tax=Caulifigura coniformis TaxID=2527983 RepID=A0A517SKV6_9PLAN|nr:hypothetical protein Pan44_48100 [Caulifigura coniformis]
MPPAGRCKRRSVDPGESSSPEVNTENLPVHRISVKMRENLADRQTGEIGRNCGSLIPSPLLQTSAQPLTDWWRSYEHHPIQPVTRPRLSESACRVAAGIGNPDFSGEIADGAQVWHATEGRSRAFSLRTQSHARIPVRPLRRESASPSTGQDKGEGPRRRNHTQTRALLAHLHDLGGRPSLSFRSELPTIQHDAPITREPLSDRAV